MIPVVVIVFFSLLILTGIIIGLTYLIKGRQISETCTTDNDCGQGMACIPNPQAGGRRECFPFDKKFCSIVPFTSLQECDPSQENSCDKCLNQPEFDCVVVDADHPYQWVQGDQTVNLPDSNPGKGWCLPNVDSKQYCNPFTSDYILTEIEGNQYKWGCYCKYPNMFDHSAGSDSDCTFVRACGEPQKEGRLYVPVKKDGSYVSCDTVSDCSSMGEQALCMNPVKQDEELCGVVDKNHKYCHLPWNSDIDIMKTVNPLFGQCSCDLSQSLAFQCIKSGDYYELNCVNNSCGQYPRLTTGCRAGGCRQGVIPDTCCDCPTGYLRCPDDVVSSASAFCNSCYNSGPICFPDPCAAGDPKGYFDRNKPGCVCPTKGHLARGDENSPVGEICVNLCDGNGPCGNRGDCYIPEGKTQAECCNCVCPHTNDGDESRSCAGFLNKSPSGSLCSHDSDCCSNVCKKDSDNVHYCEGDPIVNSPCPSP